MTKQKTDDEMREAITSALGPCPSCDGSGWIDHYNGEKAACSCKDIQDKLLDLFNTEKKNWADYVIGKNCVGNHDDHEVEYQCSIEVRMQDEQRKRNA